MEKSSSLLHKFYLTAANFVIPITLIIFSSGFFPYKPYLSGLTEHNITQYGPLPEAPFDKVIFMVVDALRSDFVYGKNSGFGFTQSLIESGTAVPFTAYARPPTVTRPRIKAISTGSIPSFIDVILNFAESDSTSSLALQDSWLKQMKVKDTGKLIMFGDDTWLKLFPETFDRVDGTTSFFVSDFSEVDTNVSRHIPQELENKDWSTMILHYLGLDHIGHKAGPTSPNMNHKQLEMDGIVNQIYNALSSNEHLRSTILLLLGDHGMNEAGNHGGSSDGETSTALVFISPKLKALSTRLQSPLPYQQDFRYYPFVEQTDIIPTLGALLGFPIPKNSLGIFIPEFLPFWPEGHDKIQIYVQNIRQILRLLRVTFPSFNYEEPQNNCENLQELVSKLLCRWKFIMESIPTSGEDEHGFQEWQKAASEWLKQAQEIISNVASNYNLSKLGLGLGFAILALVLSIAATNQVFILDYTTCFLYFTISFSHWIMMFGSSYVEEEQCFWYWATSAWLGFLSIKRKRDINMYLMPVVLLAARIASRWNQTGQKLLSQPDIAKSYLLKHHSTLWFLVTTAYMWNLQKIQSTAFTTKIALVNENSPENIAEFLKFMINQNIGLSVICRTRILFLMIGIVLFYVILFHQKHKTNSLRTIHLIHNFLTIFLFTQSRIENIPLLLIFEFIFELLNNLSLNVVEITTSCLLLQHMSFFALGGSNAISSIDLSNAYNGISRFNIITVGILTFISNWAGPILCVSASNLMLLRTNKINQKNVIFYHMALLTIFLSGNIFSVMTACTILRAHLFVWTVFAPKYLYSLAWSLGQHLCINLGLGYILFWAGTKI